MPVYVYVILVIYLIILLTTYSPHNSAPSWNSFQDANKFFVPGVLFILTLASLLGTPPSIGFFGKILTFYVLSHASTPELLGVALLTLVLLIFYIQTIRTRGVKRKQKIYGRALTSPRPVTWFLMVLQAMFICFAFTLPLVVDLSASVFL